MRSLGITLGELPFSGLICGQGLSLGDLIGVLHDPFSRLAEQWLLYCDLGEDTQLVGALFGLLISHLLFPGMSKLRFKPAYSPYTEPSMEIFSYHEGFKKWVEVGNSGMFRPEMLQPMGLPDDVRVIAWGLSLESDLFGHKVDLGLIKRNPICRLGLG
ncbi:unnamed protein product [Ilex paraguariensis]|uniref:Phenylalanyl-tRNA synthetase domain-containing protein n=1 Tax=Ilex paraguariensis TaxID=185542 RepID=A0ABC8RC83_9AQUA